MNNSSKLIAAFSIGTLAGTLLGILLQSGSKTKTGNIGEGDEKNSPSFIHRMFSKRQSRDKKFGYEVNQTEGEYEEA